MNDSLGTAPTITGVPLSQKHPKTSISEIATFPSTTLAILHLPKLPNPNLSKDISVDMIN